MDWQAWTTVGVVLGVIGVLTFTRAAADLVMLGAVALFWGARA